MHLPRPTRWRAFASAHYRPFQAIAVGQAFTGSYASDALFVPLLLRLGAPATLVVAVGAAPVGGAALQAFAPQILRRMQGNLRGLTLALALAEIRGFVLAAIVAAVASGIVGQLEGIVLISITVAIGQTAGVLSGSNISLWTAVVLPDTERRLVGPRMGALTMALSRLPRPGRVLVARETAAGTEAPPGFRRFMDVSVIASFGQGLLPALSLYALSVLGTTPGFAVALSGVGAAGALAGSRAAGSFLFRGSSSRVLRASFLLRAVAAVCCAAAFPANPLAPVLLLVGSALFNGGGNAGVLATNERLFRLVPTQARVQYQSRFVGRTAAAAGAGAVVCAATLALAPPVVWAAYTALYAGSAISRSIATLRTEVSASWMSPSAPPAEAPTPDKGGG